MAPKKTVEKKILSLKQVRALNKDLPSIRILGGGDKEYAKEDETNLDISITPHCDFRVEVDCGEEYYFCEGEMKKLYIFLKEVFK